MLGAHPEALIEIKRSVVVLRVAGKDFIAFYLRKLSEPFRNRQLIVGAHINSIRGSFNVGNRQPGLSALGGSLFGTLKTGASEFFVIKHRAPPGCLEA